MKMECRKCGYLYYARRNGALVQRVVVDGVAQWHPHVPESPVCKRLQTIAIAAANAR